MWKKVKKLFYAKKYPIISEYNDSKITFGEHAERLEKESSKYCNGEDKYICCESTNNLIH